MRKFLLTTDTSCDEFKSKMTEAGVKYIPLFFTIGEQTFEDDFDCDEQYEAFFQRIREGAMPRTSQINTFMHEEFFEKLVSSGEKEIVHLSLSGGLSSTYSAAAAAAKNVMERCPDCTIHAIDTVSATQGHRKLLIEAMRLRDEGKTGAEAAAMLSEFSSTLEHWIVVGDLMHLKRGGRVSGVAAYLGTMLNLKPILVINHEGKLAVESKAKGTKKAFNYILDKFDKSARDKSRVTIANSGATELAEELKTLIQERFPDTEVEIGWMGPVIGAHTGPGTVAIVFSGSPRPTIS